MADKKDPLLEKVQDTLKKVSFEKIKEDITIAHGKAKNLRELECLQLLEEQLILLNKFNERDFDISRALKTCIKNYED